MSNSGFIGVSLPATPQEVAEESFAYMRSAIPGWEPSPDPDTVLIEANARPAAETRAAATVMLEDAFLEIGKMIPDGARIEEAHASVLSTWTFTDTVGHTIYDGTQVLIGPDDAQVGFIVDGDHVVAEGEDTLQGVLLVAILPGANANGLTGPTKLVQHPAEVLAVTLAVDAVTAGGVDQEDIDTYRDRLSDELQLLSPSPIMKEDFAVLMRRIANCARAVAIDNYDPTDNTYGHAHTVAVCGIDAYGAPLSTADKLAATALFDLLLLQNDVVHIFDPTITDIDVTSTVKAMPGYAIADVQERVALAVTDYLDPAWWGQPNTGDQRGWIDELVVRIYELAEVINRVDGVHYITALTLRKGVDAHAAADVTIPGPAALARARVITITAVAA